MWENRISRWKMMLPSPWWSCENKFEYYRNAHGWMDIGFLLFVKIGSDDDDDDDEEKTTKDHRHYTNIENFSRCLFSSLSSMLFIDIFLFISCFGHFMREEKTTSQHRNKCIYEKNGLKQKKRAGVVCAKQNWELTCSITYFKFALSQTCTRVCAHKKIFHPRATGERKEIGNWLLLLFCPAMMMFKKFFPYENFFTFFIWWKKN